MSLTDRRGFLLLNGLAPRDRRAILVGLGILFPVVVYVMGVKPYRAALDGVRDRVAVETELLARELALLEAAATLPEELHRAEAEAAVYEDRMVRAASGVLAEAELTDLLEGAATRSRVLLEEIRGGELARGEDPPPGLSVVRLNLRGESDLEGILTFLDEIERSRLFLRVRGLALEPEVSRPTSNGSENNVNTAPVPTGVVTFQLIVDGFARVEEYGS
jgi:hypothetical protein